MLTQSLESCGTLWSACDNDTRRALRLVDKATAAVGLTHITTARLEATDFAPCAGRTPALARSAIPTEVAAFLNKLPRLAKLHVKQSCSEAFYQEDADIELKAWLALDAHLTEVLVLLTPSTRSLITHCDLNVPYGDYKHGSVSISKSTLALLFKCLPSLVQLDLNLKKLPLEHMVSLRCCKQLRCLLLGGRAFLRHAGPAIKYLVHAPQLQELSLNIFTPCSLQLLHLLARYAPQLQRLRVGTLHAGAFLEAYRRIYSSKSQTQAECPLHARKGSSSQGLASHQEPHPGAQSNLPGSNKERSVLAIVGKRASEQPDLAVHGLPLLPALTMLHLGWEPYLHTPLPLRTLAVLQLVMPQLASLHLGWGREHHTVALIMHGSKDACVQLCSCMGSEAGTAAGSSSCCCQAANGLADSCGCCNCSSTGREITSNRSAAAVPASAGCMAASGPPSGSLDSCEKSTSCTSFLQLMAQLQPMLLASPNSFGLQLCDCVAAVALLQPALLPRVQRLDVLLSSTGWCTEWKQHAQQAQSNGQQDLSHQCPAGSIPSHCQADAVQYSVHGGMLRGLPLPLLEGLSWDGVHALETAFPHATHLTLRLHPPFPDCDSSSDEESDDGSIFGVTDDLSKYIDFAQAAARAKTKQASKQASKAGKQRRRSTQDKCPVHWVVLRMGQALMALLQALPRMTHVELAWIESYSTLDSLDPATVQALVCLLEALSQHTQVVRLGLRGLKRYRAYDEEKPDFCLALQAHLQANGLRTVDVGPAEHG